MLLNTPPHRTVCTKRYPAPEAHSAGAEKPCPQATSCERTPGCAPNPTRLPHILFGAGSPVQSSPPPLMRPPTPHPSHTVLLRCAPQGSCTCCSPCQERSSPGYLCRLPLTSCRSLLQCHLLREPSLATSSPCSHPQRRDPALSFFLAPSPLDVSHLQHLHSAPCCLPRQSGTPSGQGTLASVLFPA